MSTKPGQITLYPPPELRAAIDAHMADNGLVNVQDTICRLLVEALADHGRVVRYETPKRGGYRGQPKSEQDAPAKPFKLQPVQWRTLEAVSHAPVPRHDFSRREYFVNHGDDFFRAKEGTLNRLFALGFVEEKGPRRGYIYLNITEKGRAALAAHKSEQK